MENAYSPNAYVKPTLRSLGELRVVTQSGSGNATEPAPPGKGSDNQNPFP